MYLDTGSIDEIISNINFDDCLKYQFVMLSSA
jgi:hypothetical protein